MFSGATERMRASRGKLIFTSMASLGLELTVDGQLRQAGGVELMLYPPATILAELRRFMTLEDGDIVMTGTPDGVGAIRAGELFEGSVAADGVLLARASWRAR